MKKLFLKKRVGLLLIMLVVVTSLLSIFATNSRNDPKAYAAAILDTQSSSNGSSTWSHTVNNSANRLLVVTATGNVTGVTYNNVALTVLSNQTNGASASASIWYLSNPPSGTYTVRVTGSTNAGALSLSNVNLASPFGVVARAISVGYLDIAGGTYTINENCRTNDAEQLCIDVLHVVTQVATASTSATMTSGSSQSLHWQVPGNGTSGGSMIPYTGTGVSGYTPMSWTLNGLGAGLFGWIGLTVPINSVPLAPTSTPTPTPTSPPPPPPPPLAGGDIVDLNFGIANFYPWVQGSCGSIRLDNGVNNRVPSTAQGGAYMIRQTTGCGTPGVLHGGAGPVSLGNGQSSTTNWVVGIPTYPEVYSSTPLKTAYPNLLAKAQTAGGTITSLASVCNINSCTLPVNLPSGVYQTPGNLVLQQYTFPSNNNYVFLIGGDLRVQGQIRIPVGSGTSATFSSGRDITIASNVGVIPSSTQSSIEGFFSAGRSFVIETAGVCNDLRLNVAGAIVANAARSGGIFQNNRDTCIDELTYPTISITQRLDLLLSASPLLTDQIMVSHEVAP